MLLLGRSLPRHIPLCLRMRHSIATEDMAAARQESDLPKATTIGFHAHHLHALYAYRRVQKLLHFLHSAPQILVTQKGEDGKGTV